MATRKLYRVSEGVAGLVASPQAAVMDGRYDDTNWGGDWVLVRARGAAEALRIAQAYDESVNSRRRLRPRYLRPVSLYTTSRGVL